MNKLFEELNKVKSIIDNFIDNEYQNLDEEQMSYIEDLLTTFTIFYNCFLVLKECDYDD